MLNVIQYFKKNQLPAINQPHTRNFTRFFVENGVKWTIMRFNKAISTLMAFLILSASFVTICDAGDFRSAKIHLIADPCDNHECSRNAESDACAMDESPHGICTDQSPLGEFITKTLIQFEAVVPASSLVIDELFEAINQSNPKLSLLLPPIIPAQRSTVLRI